MLIDEVDGVMEFLSQQERVRLDVVNDVGRAAARRTSDVGASDVGASHSNQY